MQCGITQLVVSAFLLVFVYGPCNATSLHQVSEQKPKCPEFMENLYKNVLKRRRRLSDVIHSITAIDVKRWNGSFEAIFDDFSFSHKESLRRARLRINVLGEKHCSSKYTLRVIDGESLRVIGEYVRVLKHTGINSIPLTRSLKKWFLESSVNKSLHVKIVFDSLSPADESSCHEVMSEVSKEAYLITHTKPKDKPRRYRLKRSPMNTSLPLQGCSMKNIQVDSQLQGGNIILPPFFTTGVCGVLHQLPVDRNAVIKEIATAMKNAIKGMPQVHNNLTCCVPTEFRKLFILYMNRRNSVTLRSFDNIVVTKCGCLSKT